MTLQKIMALLLYSDSQAAVIHSFKAAACRKSDCTSEMNDILAGGAATASCCLSPTTSHHSIYHVVPDPEEDPEEDDEDPEEDPADYPADRDDDDDDEEEEPSEDDANDEKVRGWMSSSAACRLDQTECRREDYGPPEKVFSILVSKPYPFNLSKPLLLIRDHRGRQVIPRDFFINNDLKYLKGGDLSKRYSTSVTKTKAATYEIKWIEDVVHNLFAANMSSSKDVYSRKRIIVVTRLTIMKKYDYGHLEEIEVRREDQNLYKFREGDFPRLHLQDIKYMLLLLVQQKLTNLTIDEQSNIRNMTTYTAYSDPKGVIYKDQMNRNRLIRADELHKFSDGMLDDVRSALNDIVKGIRMEYLPKRKWSGLDK
ncbi:hypothetical protein Tco_0309006 [Tanacetum coccineum]